ncbi:MAG: ATP-binding protein [Thermoprotei archaeon]|nr:MAG: ATP-binding protein [Thermoprotei archaeon]
MSPSLEEVGRIVGEASPETFLFVSQKESHPPKYEYVMIRSKELVGETTAEVEVLAQVVGVTSMSSTYTEDLDYEALQRIYRAGIDDANVICRARTLGYIVEEGRRRRILMPRRAIYPGNPVYLAPDELVEKFFSYPEEEGLHIGYLISRPRVKVNVSVNGFRRHVAIIAQTGAGKSYTLGVLLEELLGKGATIIVVDPHADYVFLSRDRDGNRIEEYADRIVVFRNPNSTGRYSEEDIDNLESLTFKFAELSLEEVADIAGVSESYTRIRAAFRNAINELRRSKDSYGPQDLIDKLKELSEKTKDRDANYTGALNYALKLSKVRVFGDRTTPIKDNVLKPFHASILDLSGLNDASQDYIVYRVLSEIVDLRMRNEFRWPVFVFVEEAHRFVPSRRKTRSSEIIKIIAAEGRKFGVFLTLVTQRPSKIDQDALSQCNSQIILRITNPNDQRAVQSASEQLGESLMQDLPGLNVGEAIIVGELTRVPVMVRVRERRSREGGADIDLVEVLKTAREEMAKKNLIRKLGEEATIDDSTLSEV